MTTKKITIATTGELIKKARISKGYTQKELGEMIGVSQAMVAQYEANKREPKPQTIEKFADALQVPISDIYNASHELRDAIDNMKKNVANLIQSPDNDLLVDTVTEIIADQDLKPNTLDAHLDGDEFTEEELEEIRKFAEFVKSKRKTE